MVRSEFTRCCVNASFCFMYFNGASLTFLWCLQQLEQILSVGFQNKFYNASMKKRGSEGQGASEYLINVSSDTPHWYIRDYLNRVSQYYSIQSADVNGRLRPPRDLSLDGTERVIGMGKMMVMEWK